MEGNTTTRNDWRALIDAVKSIAAALTSGVVSGARVLMTSSQTIPNSTLTLVAFDDVQQDPDDCYNDDASNYKYVCPASGWYILAASVKFNVLNSGAYGYLTIDVNGSSVTKDLKYSGGTVVYLSTSTPVYLSVGNYVQVKVQHNTGDADESIDGNNVNCWFSVIKL